MDSFSSNCATAFGCTDSQAINYDPFATIDDSSCVYKMTYVPDDDFENLLESFGFGDGVNNDSVFTHHLQNITYIAMLDVQFCNYIIIKQHFYTNNF